MQNFYGRHDNLVDYLGVSQKTEQSEPVLYISRCLNHDKFWLFERTVKNMHMCWDYKILLPVLYQDMNCLICRLEITVLYFGGLISVDIVGTYMF